MIGEPWPRWAAKPQMGVLYQTIEKKSNASRCDFDVSERWWVIQFVHESKPGLCFHTYRYYAPPTLSKEEAHEVMNQLQMLLEAAGEWE